jgi:hypothetical protein
MDQDIPGETFQKVSDIANKAVQKAAEVQNVEELRKDDGGAEKESQLADGSPQKDDRILIVANEVQEADATTETSLQKVDTIIEDGKVDEVPA